MEAAGRGGRRSRSRGESERAHARTIQVPTRHLLEVRVDGGPGSSADSAGMEVDVDTGPDRSDRASRSG